MYALCHLCLWGYNPISASPDNGILLQKEHVVNFTLHFFVPVHAISFGDFVDFDFIYFFQERWYSFRLSSMKCGWIVQKHLGFRWCKMLFALNPTAAMLVEFFVDVLQNVSHEVEGFFVDSEESFELLVNECEGFLDAFGLDRHGRVRKNALDEQ